MRTKTIAATGTALPWLERYSPSSSAPEHIELKDFPFTLGRSDEVDCTIVSSRVSREHAEIIRVSGGFAIRDLGSTNGTLVNGQRAEKTRLEDGDLILIADVELTFRMAGKGAPARTVTQIMPGEGKATGDNPENGEEDSEENVPLDLIRAVRAQHERLLCRGVRSHFQPFVDLESGQGVGYESLPVTGKRELRVSEQLLASTECRLTERMHQLQRLLAAEHAAKLPQGELLFLRLEPAEVGADLIPDSLARMQGLSGGKRIVATIPESAVVDIPYFRDFLARLRHLGLGVAYFGFAGNQHQVIANQELAPNYLLLAPLLARGVDKSTQRQQQIRAIVQAAAQRNTRVVATGVHNEVEAQTCRELGCQLAQGDHYSYSQVGECAAEELAASSR
jgi:EAL domain-containing protein (putative c-di-GMP-specific phosphodiesterase class I)